MVGSTCLTSWIKNCALKLATNFFMQSLSSEKGLEITVFGLRVTGSFGDYARDILSPLFLILTVFC